MLLPLNPQQLTPVQTAIIQRMSEKHLDFEIEPVNTIQPPGDQIYTNTPGTGTNRYTTIHYP